MQDVLHCLSSANFAQNLGAKPTVVVITGFVQFIMDFNEMARLYSKFRIELVLYIFYMLCILFLINFD